MVVPSGVEQIIEKVVYNVIPEQHQPMVMWLVGIGLSLWILYQFMRPFIDKWASNRQVAAINANALTPENLTDAVDKAFKIKEKLEAQKDLETWRYKLLHATTQEAKDMCNAEIAKALAIVNA
jgi:hypothetical protein